VRELAGDAAIRAHGGDRVEHGGWPARIDGGAGGVVPLQHRREQVGDRAMVADVPIIGGQADLAAGEEVVEAA
jgi:hypothetical protein